MKEGPAVVEVGMTVRWRHKGAVLTGTITQVTTRKVWVKQRGRSCALHRIFKEHVEVLHA